MPPPLPPQLLEPSAAQLSAAVFALINTLVARQGRARGLVALLQSFSFARWGLEGYVVAESNRLYVSPGRGRFESAEAGFPSCLPASRRACVTCPCNHPRPRPSSHNPAGRVASGALR